MGGIDDLKDAAEYDDNNDLIHENEIEHPQGHTTTDNTNLSALLNPGRRQTSDVNILLQEARQAAEGGVDNPAFPLKAETTNDAVPKIKAEGLEPAWKGHERGDEEYL